MNRGRWRRGRQHVWFGHQPEPTRLIWRVMSTMALLGFLLQFVLSGFGLLGLVQPPPPNPQEPHWVHDGARLFTPLPADQSHHAERHEPTWPPSGKVEPHAAPDVTVPHAHHEAR